MRLYFKYHGTSSVYQWSNGAWLLIPGGQIIGENGSETGTSIAMNADGNRIIVGSPKYDYNNNDITKIFKSQEFGWILRSEDAKLKSHDRGDHTALYEEAGIKLMHRLN